MDLPFPVLSLAIFLPLLGALLTYALGGLSDRVAKWVALLFSLATLALGSLLLVGILLPTWVSLAVTTIPSANPLSSQTYYAMERYTWFPQLGVQYILGGDELSIILVFLNTLLTPLALAFSWDEHHRVPEFFAMFLFLECTVNGIFLSLNLLQFLIFWEVQLVPMYFIIAIWGGPRRKYAAIKFFLYTFLASIPLLVSVFAFYFYGGTFDMTRLIQTTPIPIGLIGDLMFVALVVAFGTKLPTFPLHTWLPDAHVEAPTGGSVILAGILLKLGGYGLIRFNVQMLPAAAAEMWWVLAALGIISILYGAIVCLAQNDLKRMVAFSSVSHMGLVTLGLAAGVYAYAHLPAGDPLLAGAAIGFSGAVFQLFAHGIVSAALFMVTGSIGHKVGTRSISELGGIAKVAPRTATFMMVSFMASLGLPGLIGFAAEYGVFLGVYAAFGLWVLIPILTVVFTAAYYIFSMQRAIFGPLNTKWEKYPDMQDHEVLPLSVLAVAMAIFGMVPIVIYQLITPWALHVLAGIPAII